MSVLNHFKQRQGKLLFTFFLSAALLIVSGGYVQAKGSIKPPKPITRKVMVLNYLPILEAYNNQTLVEYEKWKDPSELTRIYIDIVFQASHRYLQYEVVEWHDIDQIPIKADGFQYTDESYLDCLTDNNTCHEPDITEYKAILLNNQVCEKVNFGQIDELWLWGGPWFGYREAVMAGKNAIFTEGPIVQDTTCNQPLHIMGFNYGRGPSEMIEDLGHRTEGTLNYVFGNYTGYVDGDDGLRVYYIDGPDTPWKNFAKYDLVFPNNAGCGTVHDPFNGRSNYDWGNQTVKLTTCADWLDYPNLTGIKKASNCSEWNCDGAEYKKYWLTYLPHHPGSINNKQNNWWKYIIDHTLVDIP